MYLFPPASAFITASLLPRHYALGILLSLLVLLLGMSIYLYLFPDRPLTVRIGVARIH
jgi:hypothetical protein